MLARSNAPGIGEIPKKTNAPCKGIINNKQAAPKSAIRNPQSEIRNPQSEIISSCPSGNYGKRWELRWHHVYPTRCVGLPSFCPSGKSSHYYTLHFHQKKQNNPSPGICYHPQIRNSQSEIQHPKSAIRNSHPFPPRRGTIGQPGAVPRGEDEQRFPILTPCKGRI